LLLEDDPDIERVIRNVLTRKNNRTEYVISLFVYGEVLNKLLEMDDCEGLMSNIKQIKTKYKIKPCGIPQDKFREFASTCEELSSKDPMLDPMDTMIFSAAFIDDEANCVHFLEEKMLTSRVIHEMASKRKEFKICQIK
jgi:hypothetical protein